MTERLELLDYVVFFETEPDWVDPQGWPYGARFTTARGADKVVATLATDEGEFALEWWQDQQLRLRFRSVGVQHWRIDTEGSAQWLRVSFNDPRVRSCDLQLKPYVRVEWEMTWG